MAHLTYAAYQGMDSRLPLFRDEKKKNAAIRNFFFLKLVGALNFVYINYRMHSHSNYSFSISISSHDYLNCISCVCSLMLSYICFPNFFFPFSNLLFVTQYSVIEYVTVCSFFFSILYSSFLFSSIG